MVASQEGGTYGAILGRSLIKDPNGNVIHNSNGFPEISDNVEVLGQGIHDWFGGLFNQISCPNFFGEVLEWFGFAIMTFNFGSLSFFIWTCCNLIPRGIAHHRWYNEHFKDYPTKRKAIIPYLL